MTQSLLEQKIISIRHHLHRYPELSNQEFETTRSIKGWLKEKGIESRKTALKTGVFADIHGNEAGPVVAIRADIDALPITEETRLPYQSENPGVMHACGHDFHTAALIGAAYLLKENQHQFKGTVRLIFQPAEELGGGAEQVIKDGQLDNVESIIGLHTKPDLPVGTVGLKSGPLMASVDRFHVTVFGKGAHAALPHKGQDPILTTSQIISSLQSIVSRSVSPLEAAVVTVTKINGGTTWNVIPEKVEIEGTIRTFNSAVRSQVKNRFYQIVNQTAEMFNQKVKVNLYEGPPPLLNDPGITDLLNDSAEKVGLTIVNPEVSTAGEDFAYYAESVPSAFAFIGVEGKEDWHHPKFTVNDHALLKASQLLFKGATTILAYKNESNQNTVKVK